MTLWHEVKDPRKIPTLWGKSVSYFDYPSYIEYWQLWFFLTITMFYGIQTFYTKELWRRAHKDVGILWDIGVHWTFTITFEKLLDPVNINKWRNFNPVRQRFLQFVNQLQSDALAFHLQLYDSHFHPVTELELHRAELRRRDESVSPHSDVYKRAEMCHVLYPP